MRGKVNVYAILSDQFRILATARSDRRERTRPATKNHGWRFKNGRTRQTVCVGNGSGLMC